ncbi:polysaccharide deacetylase family protein [Urechidicola sp. KH5]
MKWYFVKTPQWIQSIYKNLLWRLTTSEKVIYLTFDDGPEPTITPWVLNILKKYNAKATFFCIGKNVNAHPTIFQQIVKDEHGIGNHTYNHRNGWKTKTSNYLQNILRAEQVIGQEVLKKSKLFRPPYGKIKPSQIKQIEKEGFTVVMWDVISADFDKTISPERCYQNVITNTSNGSIIVFHDSLKAEERMKYSLKKVLEKYSKEGYVFKAIS